MSEEFKVQWSVSLPPAAQYAKGHMLNLRGQSVAEVESQFDQVLTGEFIQKATDVASLLVAAGTASEGLVPAKPEPPAAPQQRLNPAPQQQSAWGHQQAQPQQQRQQQGGRPQGVQHPEGKQCDLCGNVLELKTTQNGKKKWQCSEWRWNGGNPNGHGMEWANNR